MLLRSDLDAPSRSRLAGNPSLVPTRSVAGSPREAAGPSVSRTPRADSLLLAQDMRSDARAREFLDLATVHDGRHEVPKAEAAFMAAIALCETPRQALSVAETAADRSYVPAAHLAYLEAGKRSRRMGEALEVAEAAADRSYIQGAHAAYMRAIGMARSVGEARAIERSADANGYPQAALRAAEKVRQLP